MPLVFVGIWATGFIVARLVAPYAAPMTFLGVRFVLSAAVFALLACAARANWPRSWHGWRDALLVGVLMQGAFLVGVFWSVRHGLPAGVAALVGGLQPLLTAALAFPLLGERVGARRWGGIGIGFIGASLVLLPGLGVAQGIPLVPLLACLLGVLGMTLGTIRQKRAPISADLRSSAAVQFLGAAVVTVPIALLTEPLADMRGWATPAWVGLVWAVFGLSVGAISLLLLMIRRGAVSGVASLFYLVPPAAALIAFLAFGERLAAVQILGMAIAAAGVALASRTPGGG